MTSVCRGCALEAFMVELREEFPSVSFRYKSGSALMRFCDLALRILTFGRMCTFMSGFVSVVGATVYLPNDWILVEDHQKLVVLKHERVRMRQRARYGFLFYVLYLFVLPFGLSYFRMRFEREAYAETIAEEAAYVGLETIKTPQYRDRMLKNFSGPAYLWMWPFRRSNEAWFNAIVGTL